jgi:inorganic pyrophosphatase
VPSGLAERRLPNLLREAEYFSDIYKELEGKETAVLGWHPVKRAYAVIDEAASRYRETRGHQS